MNFKKHDSSKQTSQKPISESLMVSTTLAGVRVSTEWLKENRSVMEDQIKYQLYPRSSFSARTFPDIHDTVYKSLVDRLKRGVSTEIWQKCDGRPDVLAQYLTALPYLLQHEPHIVVLIYYHRIERYIGYRQQDHHWRQELTQEIVQRLLSQKMKYIQRNYRQGDFQLSQFNMYFMVVVRNTLGEIMRQPQFQIWPEVGVPEGKAANTEERTLLYYHIDLDRRHLRRILKKLRGDRHRVELMLRLKYRFQVTPKLVLQVCPNCPKEVLTLLTGDLSDTVDQVIFQALSQLQAHIDQVNCRPDSMRRFVQRKLQTIIRDLNAVYGRTVYDSSTFRLLAEHYFSCAEA